MNQKIFFCNDKFDTTLFRTCRKIKNTKKSNFLSTKKMYTYCYPKLIYNSEKKKYLKSINAYFYIKLRAQNDLIKRNKNLEQELNQKNDMINNKLVQYKKQMKKKYKE